MSFVEELNNRVRMVETIKALKDKRVSIVNDSSAESAVFKRIELSIKDDTFYTYLLVHLTETIGESLRTKNVTPEMAFAIHTVVHRLHDSGIYLTPDGMFIFDALCTKPVSEKEAEKIQECTFSLLKYVTPVKAHARSLLIASIFQSVYGAQQNFVLALAILYNLSASGFDGVDGVDGFVDFEEDAQETARELFTSCVHVLRRVIESVDLQKLGAMALTDQEAKLVCNAVKHRLELMLSVCQVGLFDDRTVNDTMEQKLFTQMLLMCETYEIPREKLVEIVTTFTDKRNSSDD